jgi:hypothetical protein
MLHRALSAILDMQMWPDYVQENGHENIRSHVSDDRCLDPPAPVHETQDNS